MELTTHETRLKVNELVNEFAGSTTNLQKELNKIGLSLTIVRKNACVRYVIRGKKSDFKHVIKL